MAKTKTSRKQRRSSDSPMPMSGAGLIRFFQDSSQGWKIGPIWIVSLAGVLILFVIIANLGWLGWLLGGSGT
jgi:preprotein translocase subunit Sec61beta